MSLMKILCFNRRQLMKFSLFLFSFNSTVSSLNIKLFQNLFPRFLNERRMHGVLCFTSCYWITILCLSKSHFKNFYDLLAKYYWRCIFVSFTKLRREIFSYEKNRDLSSSDCYLFPSLNKMNLCNKNTRQMT